MADMRFGDLIGTLTGVQEHKDGFVAARVMAARTGVQLYLGDEVGRPDMEVVRVYRPEAEVMRRDSLSTYKGKAVTDGHPTERVTADNDTKYRRGTIMGVARDGEKVATEIILSDAALVEKVRKGEARQLSAGYTANMDWTPGKTPDGEPYDVVQRDIYVDHLAVVPAARGGPDLRIGDDAANGVIYPIHRAEKETKVSDALNKTVVVDGRTVLTDAAGEIVVAGLLDSLTKSKDKVATLTTELADKKAEIDTKDGEITALKQQVEDAKVSPKELAAMARSLDEARTKALDMGMSKEEMDDMDEDEVKAAAVKKKMGDAAADWSADRINGYFDAMTVENKTPGKRQIGDGLKPQRAGFTDAALKAAGVKMKKEA